MDVRNRLDIFKPLRKGLPNRKLRDITHLVIHRISVMGAKLPDTPEGIATFFSTHPEGIAATGGKASYHFLVAPDGIVHQCVPLTEVAQGAKNYNTRGIQIGFIGDFTKRAPTPEQLVAGEQLCAVLKLYAEEIVGHTEDPKATAHAGKQCPGKFFPLEDFKKHVNVKAGIIELHVAGVYGIAL